jgi:hypothetical protein
MNGCDKKITVVIVISNLEYGGAQRQVVELANNIDTDCFDLHICSLSDYVPLSALLGPTNACMSFGKVSSSTSAWCRGWLHS